MIAKPDGHLSVTTITSWWQSLSNLNGEASSGLFFSVENKRKNAKYRTTLFQLQIEQGKTGWSFISYHNYFLVAKP
jgi:hypothetical protein